MGDKCKIMRPEHPECTGDKGDKCKITRPKQQSVPGEKRDKWETSVTVLRDNCNIMWPKQSQCGRKASLETNVK